jgi:hypothetical protein
MLLKNNHSITKRKISQLLYHLDRESLSKWCVPTTYCSYYKTEKGVILKEIDNTEQLSDYVIYKDNIFEANLKLLPNYKESQLNYEFIVKLIELGIFSELCLAEMKMVNEIMAHFGSFTADQLNLFINKNCNEVFDATGEITHGMIISAISINDTKELLVKRLKTNREQMLLDLLKVRLK